MTNKEKEAMRQLYDLAEIKVIRLKEPGASIDCPVNREYLKTDQPHCAIQFIQLGYGFKFRELMNNKYDITDINDFSSTHEEFQNKLLERYPEAFETPF